MTASLAPWLLTGAITLGLAALVLGARACCRNSAEQDKGGRP